MSHVLVVVLLIYSLLLLEGVSSTSSTFPVKRSTTQLISVVDIHIPLIEKAAAKLSQASFEGDPILIQNVDSPNSKTYYKLPHGDRSGATVFTRQVVDIGKSVIVLNDKEDDTLKTSKKKQTFVVLKQKKGEKSTYYVTLAYVRKLLLNENPKQGTKIGNDTVQIEWDTWTRKNNVVGKARAFGWTTCAESIFVSCQTTGMVVGKGDGHDYSEETDKVKDNGGGVKVTQVKSPNWGLNKIPLANTERTNWTIGSGSQNNNNNNDGSGVVQGGDLTEPLDFFSDLDDTPAEAKTVGVVVKVISTGSLKDTSSSGGGRKRKFHKKKNDQSEQETPNIQDLLRKLANGEGSDVGNLVKGVLSMASELVGGSDLSKSSGRTTAVSDGNNLNKEPLSDIFGHLGWKTQDVAKENLSSTSFTVEDVPFVGFGSCPNEKQTLADLNSIKTPEQAVNVYLSALRNQCVKRHASHLLRLFTDKLLTINGDKTLSIPTSNPILKRSKLTPKEISDLSKAYEFTMFSQVLAAEFRTPTFTSTSPDGSNISSSVYTIINMALHTLTHTTKFVPSHFILLTRNLLQTIKSANTKVLQDYGRLLSCPDCPVEEEELAKNDVFCLQALQQFIVTGMRAYVQPENSHTAFATFFARYKDIIAERTNSYL